MITASSSRSRNPETGENDSSYIYPTISQIRELHDFVVREYRGAEDLEDLGNIVASPEKAALRESSDVFDKASAYARSIAQNMLFKDGNKRTAVAASLSFLEINRVIDHEYYETILQEALLYLSQGDISEEHFGQFLRDAFSESV
jgi:death on curing protein